MFLKVCLLVFTFRRLMKQYDYDAVGVQLGQLNMDHTITLVYFLFCSLCTSTLNRKKKNRMHKEKRKNLCGSFAVVFAYLFDSIQQGLKL